METYEWLVFHMLAFRMVILPLQRLYGTKHMLCPLTTQHIFADLQFETGGFPSIAMFPFFDHEITHVPFFDG